MKKVVIERPGGYEQLKIQEFSTLTPKKGEVLIDVRASGINFADCLVRMGVYQSAKEFVGWPITPGFEVSGVVKAVGEGVFNFSPGQKVIGITLFNGYSTTICLPESQVFPLPDFLSFNEGAAIPTVFLTAYYGLIELGAAKKGQTILVHSAAGGVGSTLVQFGKLIGAKVVAVVGSSHKVNAVEELGADCVIDKSTEDLWQKVKSASPDGYDIILDANGTETLASSYNHLASGGRLIVYGFHTFFSKSRGTPNWFKMLWNWLRMPRFNPLYMTNQNRSVMGFNLSYLMSKQELLRHDVSVMLKWLEEKKVKPPHVTAYPFESVREAQKMLETGQTIGKLVLTCS